MFGCRRRCDTTRLPGGEHTHSFCPSPALPSARLWACQDFTPSTVRIPLNASRSRGRGFRHHRLNAEIKHHILSAAKRGLDRDIVYLRSRRQSQSFTSSHSLLLLTSISFHKLTEDAKIFKAGIHINFFCSPLDIPSLYHSENNNAMISCPLTLIPSRQSLSLALTMQQHCPDQS